LRKKPENDVIILSAGTAGSIDTDSDLFNIAVRRGCTPKLAFRVENVDIEDGGISVTCPDGTEPRARYLVDASGFRSPCAQKLGPRENPCRFEHHSRSLFTHLVNVPTDAALGHSRHEPPPVPGHSRTVHHVFERGRFGVVSFNNHKGPKKPWVRVGLRTDERTHPKTGMDIDAEFREFTSRFLAEQQQFAGATSVRPWVSTGRLQHSSQHSAGARWCLMSHAAGFLDPFFPHGLSNTVEVINVLARRLIDALRRDRFAEEQFAHVSTLAQGCSTTTTAAPTASSCPSTHTTYGMCSVSGPWARASVNSVCTAPSPNTGAPGGTRSSANWRTYRTSACGGRITVSKRNSSTRWSRSARPSSRGGSRAPTPQGNSSPSSRVPTAHPRKLDVWPRKHGSFSPPPAKRARTGPWLAAEAPRVMRQMIGGVAKEMVKTGFHGRRLF